MNLPNLKKAKAGLLATLAIGTMAVASGVAPVKVAGVSNQQKASAGVSLFYTGIVFYRQFGVNWSQANQLKQGWWDISYPKRYCAQSGLEYNQGYCGYWAPVGGNGQQA
jgi:hypothetical protein